MSVSFTHAGRTFSSNGGNRIELHRAARVAIAVAFAYGESTNRFFIADHTHEELSIGSASVAWEGVVDYDWPYTWSQTEGARELARTMGVMFEAINGCILGIYLIKD